MEKDVFISYTTANADIANDLVAYLEGKRISCYIAPRDVDPGKPYASNLMQAIHAAHAVVLLASAAINDSEHVLNELDIIVAKKKFFVPFFVEDFEMNDDYRYYLGRTQRIIAYPGDPASYYGKLYDALLPALPKKEETRPAPAPVEKETVSVAANTTKVFEYIAERGIMVNPEDHQRNVSFRTDTFISMFAGIYDSVVGIAGEERASEILHTTGYTCGQNFAQRLNSQWDLSSQNDDNFEEKLKKWCEFDSDVGWGKFDIDVSINRDTGDFSGELSINECFIVDKKNKRPVCSFVKGYCEGVMETLLCTKVRLDCVTCPLTNRFKSVCKFNIVLCD